MVIDQATDKAFDRYRDMLTNKGIKPYNHADKDFSKLTKIQQLEHVYWMCDEVQKLENRHWSVDKRHRWLGFIQCTIIINGLTTIERERNITRPWFNANG